MNTKLSKIMKDMTPRYTFKLPISKQTVSYRPFLVKEEKILADAQKDANDSVKLQYKMIKQIISNCTDIEDIDSLILAEVELIFLKLRSKSMGNMVNVPYWPEGKDDSIMLEVDLDTVEISGDLPDPKIMIDDNTGIMVTPPTLKTLLSIGSDVGSNDFENNFTEVLNIIENSITEIFTENEIIKAEDLSSKDITTFVENIPASSMDNVSNYFTKIPSLKKEIEYKEGNKTKKAVLQGLDSFI